MNEKNIDAYVVPTADFHQSEYVGEHFKARKFITGFSGSYGTAVICKDDAGLWTDGRYFFQAENEMAVEPNTVYLIPPKKNLTLKNGKLMLTEYGADANLEHQTEYLGDALN